MTFQLFTLKKILLLSLLLLNITFAIAQSDNSVLWQITGKQIKQPVYLVGTIHIYDTLQYQLPKAIFDKLKTVKKVYFELDFSRLNQAEMMQAIWIKDSSQYVNKLLDSAALNKLSKAALASPAMKSMGDRLYQLKPFYISAFLMTGPGATSLDMELFKAASLLKDSIGGVETLDEQLKAIDAVPLIAQAKMLSDMLKSNKSMKETLDEITRVYVRQDIHHMMEDLTKIMPMDDSSNEVLLHKRNVIMANRIAGFIGTQSMMIAVGAAHLGGKDGLVNSLKEKGYTLTPLAFTFEKK